MAVTTESFGGNAIPATVTDAVASSIVSGAPFTSTLTRVNSDSGKLVVPTISEISGQSWVAEGQRIPDLTSTTDSAIAVPHKLAGIVTLTREMIEDSSFNVLSQLQELCRGAFSRDLDQAALHGDGDNAGPTGLASQLDTIDGGSLRAGVVAAAAAIGEAGGRATYLALSPTAYAEESGAADTDGRALHPEGLQNRFLDLNVVQVPGLQNPVVYDAGSIYLVTSRQFEIHLSEEYAPAFSTDSIAFRLSGRYDILAAVPSKAGRVVTLAA